MVLKQTVERAVVRPAINCVAAVVVEPESAVVLPIDMSEQESRTKQKKCAFRNWIESGQS